MILPFKKTSFLAFICFALSSNCFSINYTLTCNTGVFTPNIGGTNVWSSGDDVTSNNIPIGFNFTFGTNAPVSEVSVNSNGWLALGSNFLPNYTSYNSNNLTTTSFGPILAPLWDDLKISTGGNVNYLTSGVSGNQIFTMEWSKMKWYYGATSAVISFQIKLYEANGDIEFIYKDEMGSVSFGSASIGIANQSASDFYSLSNSSNSPLANYGIETNNISVKPANGQIYKWSNNQSVSNAAIAISLDNNSICTGTNVTFSATATNTGSNPSYQWTVNGVNVGTGTTYASSSLINNDEVSCILTPTNGNAITSNSIILIVFTTPTPSISITGNIMSSSATTGNQWLINGVIINGAINQNYTATQNGNYAVIVTQNNCPSDTSIAITYNSVGLSELSDNSFQLFPNPTKGNFTISYSNKFSGGSLIEIYDMIGHLLYTSPLYPNTEKQIFSINDLQLKKGEYIVKLINSESIFFHKLILE
ncbi:MAG: T9SS type A sorting domain-containing protein [Flavobacteriia bacterium]|nr:T9SS type A sorting domain-containing protein [Flavobacteriia bacterium]